MWSSMTQECKSTEKQHSVKDVLFLHGWGGGENGVININKSTFKDAMYVQIKSNIPPKSRLLAPCWHQPNMKTFTTSTAI